MVGFDALAGRAGPDGLLPPRQRAGPAAATRSGDSDWQGIAAWPVPARGPHGDSVIVTPGPRHYIGHYCDPS